MAKYAEITQPAGTFTKVQNAAPLKDDYLSIIRDNEDPFVSRAKHPDQNIPDGITALYVRLSNDDKLDGESNSIAMQKKILERYCKEHGYSMIRYYDEDDGYSGTNFVEVR